MRSLARRINNEDDLNRFLIKSNELGIKINPQKLFKDKKEKKGDVSFVFLMMFLLSFSLRGCRLREQALYP